MKPGWSTARWMAAALGLPLLLGCGAPGGSHVVEAQDLGLSLILPPGWRTERANPRLMTDPRDPDARFGLIEDYPAEGKSLDQHVEELTALDAAAIRSRQSLTIDGCPAVELVSEAEFALVEAVIRKNDRIIRVSFRVETSALPVQGPLLRQALASIRFQR